MRKLLVILLAAMLALSVTVTASAVTGAESISIQATVSADGSAQVLHTVTIHLDAPTDDLVYPVPGDATAITLNGSRVTTGKVGQTRTVSLSRIAGKVAGSATFTVGYRLANLIHTTPDGLLQLQLPLLSGFGYPVEAVDFTVSMPMEVTDKPAFSSGYHQASIESALRFEYSGATVRGSTRSELKDHETLVMTMMVTEEVFPRTVVDLPTLDAVLILMGICAALALIYWLIWLRNGPVRRQKDTTPPAGCTAGQLGCALSAVGPELPFMVLNWAQLGYILIYIDRNHNVTLHKRMEMGNERTAFERRCWEKLFGKRDQVETAGRKWAMLCRAVRSQKGSSLPFLHKRSGNSLVFRGICAAVSMLGGVCLGLLLGTGAALQWLVVILFAALALLAGWHMQAWAYSLFSYRRSKLWLGLALVGIYLIFSAVAGLFSQGIWVCLCQLLCGLMCAFGGRRTDAGRQAMAQTLGLRRYLRTLNKDEVARICEKDPDFFHTMLPYALAMGCGKGFAKRFGNRKLPPCPYLTTGMDGDRLADEWLELFGAVMDAMYLRERQMPLERIRNIVYGFMK